MTFQIYCYLVLKSMWKSMADTEGSHSEMHHASNPQEQCAINTKVCGVEEEWIKQLCLTYTWIIKYGSGNFKN